MTDNKRVDTVSQIIDATPKFLYDSFMDPHSLIQWLPPKGMRGKIHSFEGVEGGMFRISLYYTSATEGNGKTSDKEDLVEGTFNKLIPGQEIRYLVSFNSDDPTFAGDMTQVWSFDIAKKGAKVTIKCFNVPVGISPEDHAVGLFSTLQNLAEFAEKNNP